VKTAVWDVTPCRLVY